MFRVPAAGADRRGRVDAVPIAVPIARHRGRRGQLERRAQPSHCPRDACARRHLHPLQDVRRLPCQVPEATRGLCHYPGAGVSERSMMTGARAVTLGRTPPPAVIGPRSPERTRRTVLASPTGRRRSDNSAALLLRSAVPPPERPRQRPARGLTTWRTSTRAGRSAKTTERSVQRRLPERMVLRDPTPGWAWGPPRPRKLQAGMIAARAMGAAKAPCRVAGRSVDVPMTEDLPIRRTASRSTHRSGH